MSVSSSKLTRRPWNEQEDAALLKLIEKFGCIGCWPNIARLMKSRTGKQCRERYINHLDPNTKKSPWTLLEDDIIRELYPSLNTKWSQYMSRLPGRTDNAIKNRYHAITRRNFNYYDAGHTDCSASVVSTGDKRSMAETVVEEYTDEAGEEPQAKRARVLQSASAVRSVPVRALRTLSSVSDLTTNQAESETTSSFSMDDFDFDKIAVEVAVIETEEEVLKKNLSSTDLDFEELLNGTFDLSCYNLAF
eukprot:gene10612-12392_t